MKKLFFLIPLFIISLMANATAPTITIDGDKSDWAEVPMLSEPGTWPMLKVIPAADAELGTNALAYMMENTTDFDPTWDQYPTAFIDKDYNGSTNTLDSYWAFSAMGLEYEATTGVTVDKKWISFPHAISANNKVFEIGFPATYITDLGSKFGFAMYYNRGAWYCPDYSSAAVEPSNGFLYKTRAYSTIPCTLTMSNVFAHQSMGECTDYVDFGLRDNGNDTARWAAFPIELTKPGLYSFTTNVTSTNGWKFEFWVVDVASNAVVAHLDAPENNISESKSSYTFGPIDLTTVPAGKYMLKVKNKTRYSKVKLNNIVVAYNGGAIIEAPATLQPEDAILSSEAWIDNDSILFTARGSEGHNLTNWAKWKVKITKAGYYDFTAHTYRKGHSQKFEISLLNSDESSTITSHSDEDMGSNAQTISTGKVNLTTGTYIVKVRNIYNYAPSRLMKVVATYEGGAVANVPGTLNAADAVLEAKKMYHAENGDIHYNDYGVDPTDEYAYWKIHATAGTMNVVLNIPAESTTSHQYQIELYEDLESEPIVPAIIETKTSGRGLITLASTISIASEGNYFVKLINTTKWSSSMLRSITIAPAIEISESDEDIATIIEPNDGKTVIASLTRTLTAGRYNTICLPFAVNASEMARVFPEAKVKALTSSSIEEDGFVLNLNFDDATSLAAGTPYLIQPAATVEDPIFLGVTIDETLRPAETTNADFIGNFVKAEVPAGDDNFFLGTDNKLYYSNDATPIKGLRAYIAVKGGAGAPKRARMVMDGENITTDIELVGGALPEIIGRKVQKMIQNGQLILIKDGVQYNTLGVRVK